MFPTPISQRWVFVDADVTNVSTHCPVASILIPTLATADCLLTAKVFAIPGPPVTRVPTFLANVFCDVLFE